jgi:hypothetical protein
LHAVYGARSAVPPTRATRVGLLPGRSPPPPSREAPRASSAAEGSQARSGLRRARAHGRCRSGAPGGRADRPLRQRVVQRGVPQAARRCTRSTATSTASSRRAAASPSGRTAHFRAGRHRGVRRAPVTARDAVAGARRPNPALSGRRCSLTPLTRRRPDATPWTAPPHARRTRRAWDCSLPSSSPTASAAAPSLRVLVQTATAARHVRRTRADAADGSLATAHLAMLAPRKDASQLRALGSCDCRLASAQVFEPVDAEA